MIECQKISAIGLLFKNSMLWNFINNCQHAKFWSAQVVNRSAPLVAPGKLHAIKDKTKHFSLDLIDLTSFFFIGKYRLFQKAGLQIEMP